MQLKQFIIAIASSVILNGLAFSQCTAPATPSSSNDNSDINTQNEFIADTSTSDTGRDGGQDGGQPPSDTGTTDTTFQGSDTAQQDGHDGSGTGSDTGMQNRQDGNDGSDTGMQNQHDGNGAGDGTMAPPFNSKKTDTLSGHVLSIDTTTNTANKMLTLSLETSDGNTVKVFLAPESFVKDLNFKVNKGDSVTVVGFPSTGAQEKNAYVASKVIKDGATYLFRDEKGSPFWPESRQ